jgi:hypothetical protein
VDRRPNLRQAHGACERPSGGGLGAPRYNRAVLALVDLDGDGARSSGDPVLANDSAPVVDTVITTAYFGASDCSDYVADWPAE